MRPAGKRDRLVTIEKMGGGRDPALGSRVVAWVQHGDPAWAEVLEQADPAADGQRGDVDAAGGTLKMNLLWQAGVTTAMRINDSGALYQIVGMATLGRREELALLCRRWSHE